jgi:two-component system, chemotaxis family, protein-glutamate methylesterase/glutaminase
MSAPIRVLVVDDSAVVRRLLADALGRERGIEVVGTAADAYIARRKIVTLDPDVLTLDIDMPRVDGLRFLSHLMHTRPMPVVVVSGVRAADRDVTLAALELGAVDFVAKPTDVTVWSEPAWQDIVEKIRHAARARVRPLRKMPALARPVVRRPEMARTSGGRVVAVGASTGGTEAIAEFLFALPADAPPVVIVQHMPKEFTKSFARRLDDRSAMSVKEAVHGDPIVSGVALIAPGNRHLTIQRTASGYRAVVTDGEPVNRHRPSVDVLFHSVAESAGAHAVGILLTGMGADGARGLRAMRDRGATTVAQDERSCVVFGMPREAIAMGAAEYVLPLGRIAEAVLDLTGSDDEARRRPADALDR